LAHLERAMTSESESHRSAAVVFDLGGVFFDWDPRHLYRKLIPDVAARERFLAEVCSPEWHAEQDLGRSIEASCKDLASRHPECAELILAWSERNEEMVAGVLDDSIFILRDLRRDGTRCYALSNMEPEAFAFRREHYPFMSEFDGFVISSIEGVMKPDREIYRRLLSRFELDPARTLYVDDRVANVDAAIQLGLDAWLYTTSAELRRWLVSRGLLEH
jgi:2-haloacid dehalogenase